MLRVPLLLVILLISFFSTVPTRAQMGGGGSRSVSGSVVTRAGTSPTVRITVESQNRSFNRTLLTDGAGSFTLSGVPVGTYYVTLEADGFLPQRETMEVPPGVGPHLVQFMMRVVPPRSVAAASKEAHVSLAALKAPPAAIKEFLAGERAMEARKWKDARERYEKALEAHPDFPHALRALALLDFLEGRPQAAIPRLRRAVEVDGSYFDGHLALAHILNATGAHDDASAAASKALGLRSDVWQAHYELGFAALATGKLEVTGESISKMQALGGDKIPETLLLRAGLNLKRQRVEEARTELQAFLRMAPDHQFAALAKQILADIESGSRKN